MNTRIACLLLFVITHAAATAAPKFPVRLDAAIAQGGAGTVGSLTWSPDGKTLASNGIGSKFNDRGKEESIQQLLLWDAVNWGRKPKGRILVNNGDRVVRELDFFDPNDSSRLALQFVDRVQERFMSGILNLKRPKDEPKIIAQELKVRISPRSVSGVRVYGVSIANWSRDGKKVAFNSSDVGGFAISIFDEFSEKALHTLNARNARDVLIPARKDFGLVADWSPDGKYLVTNAGKGVVIFDEKLEEELFRFDLISPEQDLRGNGINSVGWNPNAKEIAFNDAHNHLHFLDLKDLAENEDEVGAPSRYKLRKADESFFMKDGEGNQAGPSGMLKWGPQGRRIAVTFQKREKIVFGANLNVKAWIPAIHIYSRGGKLLHEFVIKNVFIHPKNRNDTNFRVFSLAWSPDGLKIAAGLSDGTIRVFKTSK